MSSFALCPSLATRRTGPWFPTRPLSLQSRSLNTRRVQREAGPCPGTWAGLRTRPRGRPQTVRQTRRAEILAATLTPPPERLGVTHWSSRLLASELSISHSTITRVSAEHDIRPWQSETFKFSTDPELEARVRDVVGLYLDPPAHAVVLCVDETSQIQALERTQPVRSRPAFRLAWPLTSKPRGRLPWLGRIRCNQTEVGRIYPS
jgi:hypothetical protein